jgi:hypothetical protein
MDAPEFVCGQGLIRHNEEYEAKENRCYPLHLQPPVHALVLNGLQHRVNIRKERPELEVLSAKGQWLFAPGQHTVALAIGFSPRETWEEFSGDRDAFIGRIDLSEATARQILWENPCRLYGLSMEKTLCQRLV